MRNRNERQVIRDGAADCKKVRILSFVGQSNIINRYAHFTIKYATANQERDGIWSLALADQRLPVSLRLLFRIIKSGVFSKALLKKVS